MLTAYRRLGGINNEIQRLRAAGLDPETAYRIPESVLNLSGAALMNIAIVPAFDRGDFQSVQIHFEAE